MTTDSGISGEAGSTRGEIVVRKAGLMAGSMVAHRADFMVVPAVVFMEAHRAGLTGRAEDLAGVILSPGRDIALNPGVVSRVISVAHTIG